MPVWSPALPAFSASTAEGRAEVCEVPAAQPKGGAFAAGPQLELLWFCNWRISVDEEEFFAFMNSRPWGTGDAAQWEAQSRSNAKLVMTLGPALWGRTPEDSQRQLLASHPDIPPGLDLADLRELLQWAVQINSALVSLQRMRGLPPSVLSSPPLYVGAAGLTVWEARCEIVRRAIDYLENR